MAKGDNKPKNLLATPITRRRFVVTSLTTGFALATLPVSAETITTDAKGLDCALVKIPVAGGQIPAYRAMPASGGPFPTIVVIHEIFGLHAYIEDICRRLAKLGYFAVAPDFFAREGNVSKLKDIKAVVAVVDKVPEPRVATDIDATVAWASSTGKANTDKLGVMGFCWGGRQTWLYVEHNPKVKAAVAWYGPLVRPKSTADPVNPPDQIDKIHTPVLGLYGADDFASPVAEVEAMQKALKAAGKDSAIIIYPNTPHGFFADYRASYRPKQAQDGWARMQAWFKAHGVG